MTQDQPDRLDRVEVSLTTHNEILMQLAPLTAQISHLLARTSEKVDNHDRILTRLENSVSRHDETLTRLENSVSRHDEAINRIERALEQLGNRVDALTTTTTETIQLVAENSRQIARSEERIEQILEYLFRQRPNGRGDG